MEKRNAFNFKILVTLFFIGMAYAIVYAAPFIQYVFYDTTLKALNATNAQLGTLVAIFGLGNLFGAPLGGILSDRYNHKTLYLCGLSGASLLSIIWAFNLSYDASLYIFFGFAFTGLFLLFPAHIKIVRTLTDENNQGKAFGWAESFAGMGSTIINAIALVVFARYVNDLMGFKAVLIFFGLCGFACTAVLFFLIKSPAANPALGAQNKDETSRVTLKDFFIVLRCPGTWFSGIAVFSTYTLYCSLSYFTPYFTNVLGVSLVFSGSLAVVRTYGIRFVMSPVAGYLGDRIGSVTKVLMASWIGAIAVLVTIMLLPQGTPIGFAIALMMLMGVFTFTARGTMFAVPSEVGIPVKYAAITGGIVCAIGYSPDLFQFILFGNWIDSYGNDAYNYIFAYNIAMCVIGVISGILSLKYKNRLAQDIKDAA